MEVVGRSNGNKDASLYVGSPGVACYLNATITRSRAVRESDGIAPGSIVIVSALHQTIQAYDYVLIWSLRNLEQHENRVPRPLIRSKSVFNDARGINHVSDENRARAAR